jgi:citrate synthase
MPTSREYRYRAEDCLKLANEAKEIYARMALLELAGELHAMAQQLDLRARRALRRTNAKQHVSFVITQPPQ